MLSVLIPVYNFNIRELVTSIHKQAEQLHINFEIRCYDDASEEHFYHLNQSITSISNVIFQRLDKNLGRSAIRNKLAKEALYDNLLFMDCDSKLQDNDFLKRYIERIDNKSVIYGGRSYEVNPPKEKSEYLRWKYGVGREVIAAKARSKRPYDSFMTNNFLIPKAVFTAIGFDESIQGYGHEDTKFGYQLLLQKVPIVHIHNPLIHIGLEDTDEFLRKTNEGLKNLLYLYNEEHIPLSHLRSIRLLRYFNILKKTGMRRTFLSFYKHINKSIERNLHSKNLNLIYFDLYKLGKLTELSLKGIALG